MMDKWFENPKEGRHFAALLLCLGLIQIAGYWLVGSLVNGPGPLAIAQPDTALYCQAAARVAEGHPFSYSSDTVVCTGTTSVLYPFLLAIPYLLGFKGASLVSAGFWLNAFFYLLFLAGWGYFIWRRFENPVQRVVTALGLALFPQTAYCALAQSDIGCWLACSGLFAAALASRKAVWYGLLLALCPWLRPEGMICVMAFLGVSLCNPRRSRVDLPIALFGAISTVGVFALNYALTGHAQFSSVANKGHFATNILSMAIEKSAVDFMSICRGLFWGQPLSSPRIFYFIPLVGTVLTWIGVFVHDWRQKGVWSDFILLTAIGGSILSVAQSGWQNTNVDRYLAWIMPMFVIFMCEGMVWTWNRIRIRSSAAILVLAGPLVFSAMTGVLFFALFNACSEDCEHVMSFGRHLDRILPAKASYGVTGSCGIAYTLPGRRCAHLSGIYSPEFSAKTVLGNMEILKREPSTRFDYWFFAGDDVFPEGLKEAQKSQVAVGPEGFEVRQADWSIFDAAAIPHANETSGKTLMARLDVGYETDEKTFGYEVVPHYGLRPFDAIGRVEKLAGTNAFDVGRIVYGEDRMILPLVPGKDVTMVMRTLSQVKFSAKSSLFPNIRLDYAYADPLTLEIEIDGENVCKEQARIAKEGFTDAVFTIPGKAITRSPCNVVLRGDHVTFGYWFYQ